MGTRADVVVVGLGAMGSAALRALALRRRRVVGLDRFSPPHTQGSSHGRSRIIREAYFEHPVYVPLVQRAYTLWAELEREAGRPLLRRTGGLAIGPQEGELVQGALLSARTHGLPCEQLSAAEVRRRFPAFTPDETATAVLEPRAGVLFPEAAGQAALDGAAAAGADVRCGDEVLDWRADGAGVRVRSTSGEWSADQVVFTAGPWLGRLVPGLPLTVERQVFHWFAPARDPALVAPQACPIALWEFAPGRLFYTLPDLGDGVKAALHHDGETVDPDRVRREVGPGEVDEVRALLERLLPSAAGARRESSVCLYTNTPDRHFLVDRHPEHPQALLVSPCSGHGFKFAPVIGEAVADLVTGSAPRVDLRPFALARFGRGAG